MGKKEYLTKENLRKIPEWIEKLAKLLDSSIKIPGTKYTIGLDPIISIIPGLGDAVSYLMSAVIVIGVVKHGASGKLVMKMLGNILLDFVVGLIPVIGTIFDFTYKANDRNMRLMKEYQQEGMHKGTGLGILLVIIGITVALLILGFVLAYYVFRFFQDLFTGA